MSRKGTVKKFETWLKRCSARTTAADQRSLRPPPPVCPCVFLGGSEETFVSRLVRLSPGKSRFMVISEPSFRSRPHITSPRWVVCLQPFEGSTGLSPRCCFFSYLNTHWSHSLGYYILLLFCKMHKKYTRNPRFSLPSGKVANACCCSA